MHQSVATIDSPEFINLQPLEINPLMSSCQIKVLYTGQNRNGSSITKEVATEMSKTLRGAPIVGYYKEDKEDFRDHGEKITIDGDGVHFMSQTRPYGFVSPDAKVWFQKFEDTDDMGNVVEREYLMTTGYLWTGQYPEAQVVINEGRPQSMELDEKSLQGESYYDNKKKMNFFIINDAIFSKLCILGEDIEPCFEGSNVTSYEENNTTNLEDFNKTLFSMIQDLRFVLKKGGQTEMPDNTINEEIVETSFEAEKEEKIIEESAAEVFEKKEDKEEDKDNEKATDTESSEDKEDKEEEDKKKYTLMGQELNEIKTQYAELETKYNELLAFKANIEDKQKDEMINKFYMLSDEDKKEVIENKANYTLDDIEAKLSVICFRKKINFNLNDEEEETETAPKADEESITTFSLNDTVSEDVPAWIAAVMKNRTEAE